MNQDLNLIDFDHDDHDLDFDLDIEDEPAGMNITPMVDVIFILLVFFLCVSQLKSSVLPLTAPSTEAPAPSEPSPGEGSEPIAVEINKDGTIAIARTVYKDEAAVRGAIAKLVKEKGPQQVILFRGDKSTNYGAAMQLVAWLYNAGLQRIEFEVDPTRAR